MAGNGGANGDCDILDMTPRDSISDKVMWSNVESAEFAVNDIYSYTYEIVAEWPSAVGMTEAFTDAFKYGSYVNFAFCLIPSQVAYGGTNLTNSFVDVYLGRCRNKGFSACSCTNSYRYRFYRCRYSFEKRTDCAWFDNGIHIVDCCKHRYGMWRRHV